MFSCLGTLFSHFSHVNPGVIRPITAILTLLVATFTLISVLGGRREAMVAALGVMVLGAVAESVGLFTGLPFGRYEYTSAWWPTVALGPHRFPLLLPMAWFMVVTASYLLVRCRGRGSGTILTTGILAALIDIPMEAAMTGPLGYWKWIPNGPIFGAPWMNVFGWFTVSCLAAAWLHRFYAHARSPGRVPGLILILHLLLIATQLFGVAVAPLGVALLMVGVIALCLPTKVRLLS